MCNVFRSVGISSFTVVPISNGAEIFKVFGDLSWSARVGRCLSVYLFG